ncbi:MAG: glycosyltransferase family 2 protein [Candidatus Promineifilaceae bacterium]
MAKNNPKVSLGLPVYNGDKFVAQAIESVLNQTFTDFELIISDNCSTDHTQQICERYAAQDSRVKYHRNVENLGAAANFNCCFELSSGEYFKWVAADDLIAPEFVERCVEELDRDPSFVLCFTNVHVIDEEGELVDKYDINLNTQAADPGERFRSLTIDWHMCFDVFGLIRSDALRQTPVMGNYGHGDGVLLARLGLMGRFQKIHDYLFFSRRHPEQSMRSFGYAVDEGGNDYHAYAEWFDPENIGKLVFPQWRILWEYYRSIWWSVVGWGVRLRAHFYLLWWSAKNRRHLWNDLRIAGESVFPRIFTRKKIFSASQNESTFQ